MEFPFELGLRKRGVSGGSETALLLATAIA